MGKYITVEAEVSLDDLDEDDLVEHLESKGYLVSKTEAHAPWIMMYEALRYQPDPLPILKQIVCDATGRVL